MAVPDAIHSRQMGQLEVYEVAVIGQKIEMSQCTPVMAHVTAATAHQTYQGTANVAVSRTGTEMVADNSDTLCLQV